jgi:hypothetical protein
MKIKIITIMILWLLIIITLSGCISTDDDGKDKDGDQKDDYFSETYNRVLFEFNFEFGNTTTNNSSHVIIPRPIQNDKELDLAEYQDNPDFNNFSYTFIETEHGSGLKIEPAPSGKFWLWFSCEPYTVIGPFDIKQNVQCYKENYPELSTWETDGTAGYYWFFSSINFTKFSYQYWLSDCYFFMDMGGLDQGGSPGWQKIKYMRTQEDMPM